MMVVMFTACQSEEMPPFGEGTKTGCIVLSLPEVQLYTEANTRAQATADIEDFVYKVNSVNGSSHVVSDSTISFTSGTAVLPAGTYTLTATSKSAQDAGPWYQGTSSSFSLLLGGTQEVSINLGKPKNVEIAVTFDKSFTDLYENYSVTIGGKSVSANGRLYAMPDEWGKVTYTIKGSAKAGSHVSDIPAEGITGTITVEAGNSYPLNITASSISDLLILIGEGTHNGEFDTKEYRPLN
jgi:hypothetical protein